VGKKKPKKPDKTVRDVLYDWASQEILLTHQVYSQHIASAAHDEAYEYYETLKANISKPESVVISKTHKRTKIANIKLLNRKHKYLRVVIRYSDIWKQLLGTRNYVTTFYGANSPMIGETVYVSNQKD